MSSIFESALLCRLYSLDRNSESVSDVLGSVYCFFFFLINTKRYIL